MAGRLTTAGVFALAAALVLAGCAGTPVVSPRRSTTSTRPAQSSTVAPSTTSVTELPSTTPPPSTNPAAALPQTDVRPTTASPQFRTAMEALFQAIRTDRPDEALVAYFPEAAYVRLKAIGDPALDWHDRLFYDFKLDLAAAHRYLFSSPGATAAHLVRVAVASDEEAWIPPGYCYNSIGYWHAPGVRLIYRQAGVIRSIGIASLISWRGQWYVVHLGAVLRSSNVGIVDTPSFGMGSFAPAGGC